MKRDVDKFLELSLLEEYILGSTNAEESRMVEDYIASSEKVRSVYNELQENLEWLAKRSAVKAPLGLKDKILKDINKARLTAERNLSYRLPAIAATLVALMCAVVAFNYWNQNKIIADQLAEQEDRIINLLSINQDLSSQIAFVELEKSFINDPETERYILRGNNKVDGFVTLAYWNRTKEEAYIKVEQLAQLDSDKCLQMWADVDGEMINVGILPDQTDDWVKLNFLANAESLNITIEPSGGSDHPTVSDLVASILI